MKNKKVKNLSILLVLVSTVAYAGPLKIFKNSAQKSSNRMYSNPIKPNPNRVDAYGRPWKW